MGPWKICPECGDVYKNLTSHQGELRCQRERMRRQIEQEGWIPIRHLWEHLVEDQVPKAFQRFVREISELARRDFSNGKVDKYVCLPKWVCAMIIAGHWTDASIKRVETDPELQVAFALEYDIRRQEN